jgi:hypothetical protein
VQSIRKRLTYANVMSSLAVFLVLGGATALAAGKLGKNSVGTNQIKKNAVTGVKVKKHTLTGTQINLAKLGTVPNATSAVNATNATNAANAANLNGMTRFRTTISPSGTSEATANVVTLYADGPLSLVGKCWSPAAGEIEGQAYLRSSVAGYWSSYSHEQDGTLTPGTDEPALEDEAEAKTTEADFEDPYDGTFAAIAADRSAYFNGLASVGANLGGSGGCTFAGWAMSS